MDSREPVECETALFAAARAGSHEVARLLIDRHADVDARDGEGRTPLDAAAAAKQMEMVRLLLDRGALVTRDHQTVIDEIRDARRAEKKTKDEPKELKSIAFLESHFAELTLPFVGREWLLLEIARSLSKSRWLCVRGSQGACAGGLLKLVALT